MVLPMDMRDSFVFEDAALEAKELLQRPVSMLFNCPAIADDDEDDDDQEWREVLRTVLNVDVFFSFF